PPARWGRSLEAAESKRSLPPATALCMFDAPLRRLHLEPIDRPFARPVRRVHPFSDDALDAMICTRVQRRCDGAVKVRNRAPCGALQREPVEERATPDIRLV